MSEYVVFPVVWFEFFFASVFLLYRRRRCCSLAFTHVTSFSVWSACICGAVAVAISTHTHARTGYIEFICAEHIVHHCWLLFGIEISCVDEASKPRQKWIRYHVNQFGGWIIERGALRPKKKHKSQETRNQIYTHIKPNKKRCCNEFIFYSQLSNEIQHTHGPISDCQWHHLYLSYSKS